MPVKNVHLELQVTLAIIPLVISRQESEHVEQVCLTPAEIVS